MCDSRFSAANSIGCEMYPKSFSEEIRRPLLPSRAVLYLLYTVLFALVFLTFSYALFRRGGSFIWLVDGLEQQYPFFILEGNWLRDLVDNLTSGRLELPMWTSMVGYGADYLISASNTLGNPINLLSIFASPENAEYLLNLTVPLTLYLAGISFLGYCAYKRWDRASSIVGSLAYIFTGFSVIAFYQVFMVYPLVLAPLVLQGVDRVFDEKSPVMLSVSIGLCCFYSVTVGYAVCLLLFVYCCVRFFYLGEKKSLRNFFGWFFKILPWVFVGILLAGILFFPIAQSILSQGRVGLERPNDLLYDSEYYRSLFLALLVPQQLGADCFLSLTPIGVVSILILLLEKKGREERVLLWVVAIFTAFLLFPLFGKVFNGFAYPNNRWVWAYSLIVGVATVLAMQKLGQCNSRRTLALPLLCSAFACLAIMLFGRSLEDSTFFQCVVLTLILTTALLHPFGRTRSRRVAVSIACITLSTFIAFSEWGIERSGSNVSLGSAYETAVSENPKSLVLEQSAEESTRVEGFHVPTLRNDVIALGVQGNTFYNSYYNSYIDEYHNSLGLVTAPFNFSYTSLDARGSLLALSGTNYLVCPSKQDKVIPRMFDQALRTKNFGGTDYTLFATNHILPLAYTVDSSISRDEYDLLAPVQRQEALLQGIVLDQTDETTATFDPSASHTVEMELSSRLTDTPASVGDDSGDQSNEIRIEGNSIVVLSTEGTAYLCGTIPSGREAYLTFEGLSYAPLSESDNLNRINVAISTDDGYSSLSQTLPSDHMYAGKDTWAANLGVSKNDRTYIALKFNAPGIYSFKDLRVDVEDTDVIIDNIDKLASAPAQDISFSGNNLTCTVAGAGGNEYLYFRIPYSQGWSAFVNGRETEILNANVGFMAIKLAEGTNNVRLHYETPGLKIGVLCTTAGLVTLVASSCCRRHKMASTSGALPAHFDAERRSPRLPSQPRGRKHPGNR